ncbi:MAG: SRPBCC family protein [Pseudomonadota bacterium]
MRLVRTLVIGLALLAAALIGGGLLLPERAAVTRTLSIEAPAATVFALANALPQFNRWSPWLFEAPASVQYSGPRSGVGAVAEWSYANGGYGRIEITASEPHRTVEQALTFDGGGAATTTIGIQPDGDGVVVSVTYSTEFAFDLTGRYVGLFHDRLFGARLETALDKLGRLAQTP